PMLQPDVYASKWPSRTGTLWTIVNRSAKEITGRQLAIPEEAGMRYYDLWNGVELKPEEGATLSFPIEPRGYGAILATKEPLEILAPPGAPLQSYSQERTVLLQQIVSIPRTGPAPEGMIRIPGGDFDFEVSGVMVEGGDELGVDVQYPWESTPRRQHRYAMKLAPYSIDRFP